MGGNIRRKNSTKRDNTVRWLRAQGRPCWMCQLPIDYNLPGLHPLSFECDELDPVSRGGSPTDRANVDAAHRCCNNWRKAKTVGTVIATRDELRKLKQTWTDPREFVMLAKALKGGTLQKQKKEALSRAVTTTDW